jgi:two-component system, cell cycle sensor histidine kinase and response regulator CckA
MRAKVSYTQAAPEGKSTIAVCTRLPECCGPATILLVEDEDFVREITGEILENEGFRVLKARNAAEAESTFRRYGKIVRLLLTDVVLPGKNGRDLAAELRRTNPRLPTIFVSGYPENAVTQKALVEGMFYLPKPFSAASLLRKLQHVLAKE